MKALTKVGLAALLVTTVCAMGTSLATANTTPIFPTGDQIVSPDPVGPVGPIFDDKKAGGIIVWW